MADMSASARSPARGATRYQTPEPPIDTDAEQRETSGGPSRGTVLAYAPFNIASTDAEKDFGTKDAFDPAEMKRKLEARGRELLRNPQVQRFLGDDNPERMITRRS